MKDHMPSIIIYIGIVSYLLASVSLLIIIQLAILGKRINSTHNLNKFKIMKRLFFASLLLFGCIQANAQNPTSTDQEPLYQVVETAPRFEGCAEEAEADANACSNKNLITFLSEKVVYPKKAKNKGIQGKVIVSFIIEKDGSVSTTKVLRGVHKSLDNEAMRVVNEMPKWTPGTQRGKAVRVQYTLPIIFSI